MGTVSAARTLSSRRWVRREEIEFYIGISPWLVGFLLFSGVPILASFGISLSEWKVLQPPTWVGFANYRDIVVKDPLFITTLFNTTYYTVFSVPLVTIVAFATALLTNQGIPGSSVFRMVFYLPSVTAGVAMAILWVWILNPQFGLLNYALSLIGIRGPGWILDPVWAKPALVLLSVWGIGSSMVIFLAGLQSLPQHLYEAAWIDGADRWTEFWHLTIPLMSPVIFFVLIVSIIGSFQTFTNVYVMTSGGPGTATLMYSLYLYQNAFQYLKMGYASALAWILFAIILALTLVQFWLARRWVYYEGELGKGSQQ